MSREPQKQPLAIVGMGCRYPGGADNPSAYWKLLLEKRHGIGEVPRERFEIDEFYHPDRTRPGTICTKAGAFLKNIDLFDADFFGISPREASRIDPQQRLLLKLSWEALEDAGIDPNNLRGSRTGVFVGISADEYGELQQQDPRASTPYSGTGGCLSVAANRISFSLDLRGPSLIVDTACSSSLVALHLACQSVWHGDSSMAIVGGVNLIVIPARSLWFSSASMLSVDGRCYTFDSRANGYVRGEGAGVVVVKPLALAERDGDTIHALILATGINQDGHSVTLSVPNGEAQKALCRQVFDEAGVAPHEVGYVEAHGTGTPVGDPIEADAIGEVFGAGRPLGQECLIGSVKTNIGHLESGSGVAGLIKLALSLKNGVVPAHLNFAKPNPKIDFAGLRLRVPVEPEPFPQVNGRAVGGVASFGFGGTNAHAALSRYVPSRLAPETPAKPAYLLPISARTPLALEAMARAYRTDVFGRDDVQMADVCYSASRRRAHHDHRLTLSVRDAADAREKLDAFSNGETRAGMTRGKSPTHRGKLAFVFSGNGPQWWAMGRQLFAQEPIFEQAIRECDAKLAELCEWSLVTELHRDEATSRMRETSVAQPALFALQVALIRLWRSWGVKPDGVVGHSVGEVAAAYAAGVLSLDDAISVIHHRSRTQERTAGSGRMAAVELNAEKAAALIAPYGGKLEISAINAPSSVTISGDSDALQEVVTRLEAEHVFCRVLPLNYAFHSYTMDPVRRDLTESLAHIRPQPSTTRFVSTVTGSDESGPACSAEYWWDNIRKPVLFSQTIERLISDDFTLFLEIGPHPALASYIAECASGKAEIRVLPSLRRKDDELPTLLGSLGALYVAGYPVAWEGLYPAGRVTPLPAYAWQEERHWNEPRSGSRIGGRQVHPLLGRRIDAAQPQFQAELDFKTVPYLRDHSVQQSVILPGTCSYEIAAAAAGLMFPDDGGSVEDIELREAVGLAEGKAVELQTTVDAANVLTIYSREAGQEWRARTRARLSKTSRPAPAPVAIDEIRRRCPVHIDAQQLRAEAARRGTLYGPTFHGLQQLWAGDGEAIGEVHVAEGIASELGDYHVHPAVLDACTQVLIALLPGWADPSDVRAWLPVRVARYRALARPTGAVFSWVRIARGGAGWISADLTVIGADGSVIAEFEGFRVQAMTAPDERSRRLDRLLYEFEWVPERGEGDSSASEWPLDRMAADVRAEGVTIADSINQNSYYMDVEPRMRALTAAYILKAFGSLGWAPAAGTVVQPSQLGRDLGIDPMHFLLLDRLLEIVAEFGGVHREGAGWRVDVLPVFDDTDPQWRGLVADYPAYLAELTLLGRCGSRLAEALTGQIDGVQLIFPDKSSAAEHLYESAPVIELSNRLLQQFVRRVVAELPQSRRIRVLEIGAGTGGATSWVLPVLPADRTDYVYTDVSNVFLAKAEQKFRRYPFVQYRLLDSEQDPTLQGFTPGSFDLVIASNSLHATRDLRTALTYVSELAAPGGLVALIESTLRSRWFELVFGLLKGWWHFTDHDLRTRPLLGREQWLTLLPECGLMDAESLTPLPLDGGEPTQHVLIARTESNTANRRHLRSVPGGTWLVFADRAGRIARLGSLLASGGHRVITVESGPGFAALGADRYAVDPAAASDMERLIEALQKAHLSAVGIVHGWAMDGVPFAAATADDIERAQEAGSLSVIHLVQALSAASLTPRLWIATAGVHALSGGAAPIDVAAAPVWGLARVIFNEHPDLRCTLVDLSADSSDEEIENLYDELLADNVDEELALRGTERYVHRVVPASHRAAVISRAAVPPDHTFRLDTTAPGILDSLTFRAVERRAPAPGEVEIEVYAAGMNYKDILQAMGVLAGEALEHGVMGGLSLGLECAGRVTRIGTGVTDFTPGDDVVAFARHSFGGHVTVSADLTASKPAHLSFEEAATIPATFFTAYYALHHEGRLRAGHRVLVHGAAGGVGLAAIQLVHLAGAEVFATAGTAEKRDVLRALGVRSVMDSRSLRFADDIRAATGGDGVDLVLNSIAGDAVTRSLEVLRPFGRFLELGKRDLLENAQIGLRPFERCLSFHAIDVDQLMLQNPALSRTMLREVMALFESRELRPLPHRVFEASQIENAFRALQQSRHIGKVVVSMRGDVAVEPPAPAPLKMRPDATYIIVGGVRGLGLAVAGWLMQRGARHLTLLARRGPDAEGEAAIAEMRTAGATVLVRAVDVTDAAQVGAVFGELRAERRPVAGIIQGALVLDDTIVLHLNRERLLSVMRPKMLGAFNLHRAAAGEPLDFFVSFSSFSAMVGNPGQANYAAANVFLDALAFYRRNAGQTGLSINWGPLGEVGYVARHADVGQRLGRQGLRPLDRASIFDVIAATLPADRAQIGAMDIEWQQWNQVSGVRGTKLSRVITSGDAAADEERSDDFHAMLGEATADERQRLIESRLRDHVASVLGTAASKLDRAKPLTAHGLDSLMAVELQIRIQRDLEVEVPLMNLLQQQCIADLALMVSERKDPVCR